MRPGPAGRNPKMCRLRRHRSPGPAPAGGPTSCAPKKSAEEGRSRGLPPVPLRNPREYLAMTRRLPSLPTGTPAVGTTQVADAPNDGNNGAASLPGRGTRGRGAAPPPREAHAHRLDRSRGQLRAGATTDVRLALPTTEAGGLAGDTRRKTTPVPGVRAPCARAAVPPGFPPPRGRCAPRKSGRASPKRTPGTVPEAR